MWIAVRFFAILRERAGTSEMVLELPEGSDVAAARAALAQRVPLIAEYLGRVAFAVNREYAATTTVLREGDELAVIPPVSGGAD